MIKEQRSTPAGGHFDINKWYLTIIPCVPNSTDEQCATSVYYNYVWQNFLIAWTFQTFLSLWLNSETFVWFRDDNWGVAGRKLSINSFEDCRTLGVYVVGSEIFGYEFGLELDWRRWGYFWKMMRWWLVGCLVNIRDHWFWCRTSNCLYLTFQHYARWCECWQELEEYRSGF